MLLLGQSAEPCLLIFDLAPYNGDELVSGVQRFPNGLDFPVKESAVVRPLETPEDPPH